MMTAGQRRAFLYEAMRGDGTTKGKWPNLKTNPSSNRELLRGGASWRLALADAHQSDAVQHIAALLGLRTSVSLRKNYRLVTLWQRAGDAQVGKMQRSEFVHAGAWCPTTETGFWVARRSGRLFITGNSHIGDALAHGAAVIFPLGTLRESKPATPPKEASW